MRSWAVVLLYSAVLSSLLNRRQRARARTEGLQTVRKRGGRHRKTNACWILFEQRGVCVSMFVVGRVGLAMGWGGGKTLRGFRYGCRRLVDRPAHGQARNSRVRSRSANGRRSSPSASSGLSTMPVASKVASLPLPHSHKHGHTHKKTPHTERRECGGASRLADSASDLRARNPPPP